MSCGWLIDNQQKVDLTFQKLHLTVVDMCEMITDQDILQLKQNHQMKDCKYIMTIVGLGVC